MNPVICLDPLFPNLPAEGKISRVAARGFSHVEFWGWRDKNIAAIEAACRQHGVRVANFNGHRKGSPIAEQTHKTLFADVADAVPIARVLDCHALMLLTNVLNADGSVAERFEEIPDELKFKNVVSSLAELTRTTPDDITLLLEPLNTLVDHPGYYLDNIDVSAEIVRQVGSPRLKILCDLYHFGVMGADLERLISEHLSLIGHFHIADFPGRHEPGPVPQIGQRCCARSRRLVIAETLDLSSSHTKIRKPPLERSTSYGRPTCGRCERQRGSGCK